jgi:hypothetical protein
MKTMDIIITARVALRAPLVSEKDALRMDAMLACAGNRELPASPSRSGILLAANARTGDPADLSPVFFLSFMEGQGVALGKLADRMLYAKSAAEADGLVLYHAFDILKADFFQKYQVVNGKQEARPTPAAGLPSSVFCEFDLDNYEYIQLKCGEFKERSADRYETAARGSGRPRLFGGGPPRLAGKGPGLRLYPAKIINNELFF